MTTFNHIATSDQADWPQLGLTAIAFRRRSGRHFAFEAGVLNGYNYTPNRCRDCGDHLWGSPSRGFACRRCANFPAS